ncbi:MAG: c-type cytochrome [Melioribacteraceae bacterium]|nr:c-type cytochrome [Melioribacteraceae bacterium]
MILKRKAEKSKDEKYIKLAKDLVNIAALNRSVVYALGIIPFLSALFCYIQILQNSSAGVVSILIAGFITFVFGLILFFSYKDSFNLKSIFSYLESKNYSIEDVSTKETINIYSDEATKKYKNADIWSFVLFIITALLVITSIVLAANPELWGEDYSLYSTIFSVQTVSYLIYFFILSLVFTLIVGLFYYYKIRKPEQTDPDYLLFVRDYTVNNGLVLSLLMPVFILLGIIFTPQIALSSFSFIVAVVLLVAIMIFASLLYLMQKEKQVNYISILLSLVIFFFILNNTKDQIAFSASSKTQLAKLEANFVEYEEEFKSSLGLAIMEISGEDIYNGKCVACHQFDQVLVGPPYKDVLPKYENDQEALAQFILNPVKIDDSYPAMPNQGLKPNEAQAVAEYLLETYKQ